MGHDPGHAPDRGSALVLVLGVVTALAITTAALLQATHVVARRERSAWSTVVALSDVQSTELVVLDTLRRQPTLTCGVLTAQPPPALGNGSQITVTCSGGAPPPWTVTVSAVHGPRSITQVLVVALDADGRPAVQARSIDTAPKPALTSAA